MINNRSFFLKSCGAIVGIAVAFSGALHGQTHNVYYGTNPPDLADPYPVLIRLNESFTPQDLPAVHGVNGGPVNGSANPIPYSNTHLDHWEYYYKGPMRTGPSIPYSRTNEVQSLVMTPTSNWFEVCNIPQARSHTDGISDMSRIWRIGIGGVEGDFHSTLWPDTAIGPYPPGTFFDATLPALAAIGMQRTYPNGSASNPLNYEWTVFDEWLDGVYSSSGTQIDTEAVIRVGESKHAFKSSGSEDWVLGPGAPPDDYDEFAEVLIQIVEHVRVTKGYSNFQYIELWNEAWLENYWNDKPTSSGTAEFKTRARASEYFQLYKSCLAAVDTYNTNHPNDPEVILIAQITPHNGWWTDQFLDECVANLPAALAVDNVAPHLYTDFPWQQRNRMQKLLETFVIDHGLPRPNLFISEWNRTIGHYAADPGAMPYLVSTFFHFMNWFENGPGDEGSGSNFAPVRQAHYFGGNKLWTTFDDDQYNGAPAGLLKSGGLWWKVFGDILLNNTPHRILEVEGCFGDEFINSQSQVTDVREFTVLATKNWSTTNRQYNFVISSLHAYPEAGLTHPTERGVKPGTSTKQQVTVNLEVSNINGAHFPAEGVGGITMEIWAEKEPIQGAGFVGQELERIDVRYFAFPPPAFGSSLRVLNLDELIVMDENSYVLVKIF